MSSESPDTIGAFAATNNEANGITRAMSESHPYEIGKNYFIRTVTNSFTGTLVAVYEHELVIENAAWIADTGRFANSLIDKIFAEIEPYPDGKVVIGRGALVDCSQIKDTPQQKLRITSLFAPDSPEPAGELISRS